MGWTHYNKPLLGTPLDGSEPLSQGLVGLWLMNEGSGSEVFDLSGNGNTGSFAAGGAAPSWTAGQFGSAISGDGGDYITIANESNFDFERTDPISVSCWFNMTNWFGSLVSKQESGGNFRGWELLARSTAGTDKVSFEMRSGAGSSLLIDTVKDYTSLLGWHHAVATYSGNSDISGVKIYVDGIDEPLSAQDNNLTTTILNSVSPQMFGRNGANFIPTGQIDNIMIWNRTLTASEAVQLFLNPFIMFERDDIELWAAATQVVAGANPKGPLGHPLHGALAGPISF